MENQILDKSTHKGMVSRRAGSAAGRGRAHEDLLVAVSAHEQAAFAWTVTHAGQSSSFQPSRLYQSPLYFHIRKLITA